MEGNKSDVYIVLSKSVLGFKIVYVHSGIKKRIGGIVFFDWFILLERIGLV